MAGYIYSSSFYQLEEAFLLLLRNNNVKVFPTRNGYQMNRREMVQNNFRSILNFLKIDAYLGIHIISNYHFEMLRLLFPFPISWESNFFVFTQILY